jgi:hypothetical protein
MKHERGLVFEHESKLGNLLFWVLVIGIMAFALFQSGRMYERKQIVTLTSEVKP